MTVIPTDPNALLKREKAAEALSEAGFPISAKTLATLACRGGSPTFQKFGRTVLYRWCDLLSWAESRLSAPRRSTSEADAAGEE